MDRRNDEWVRGRTFHLTSHIGTAIDDLDGAFHRTSTAVGTARNSERKNSIDDVAAPFVQTFQPYFRNDPVFDRTGIDALLNRLHMPQPPPIDQSQLIAMIGNWNSPSGNEHAPRPRSSQEADFDGRGSRRPSIEPKADVKPEVDPSIVICGFEVRLPGGVNQSDDFEALLFDGRSAIDVLPTERLDRELYFDSRRGTPGKTYTEIGGWVDESVLDEQVDEALDRLGTYDLTHRQFARVAASAMRSLGGDHWPPHLSWLDLNRAGVFVGHSGGTESGGSLALATLASAATRSLVEPSSDSVDVESETRQRVRKRVVEQVRANRPRRSEDGGPHFNAYSAAALASKLLGFRGRREVIDAACSSSLVALQHAAATIKTGALDLAIVGGATFNNVDNLALFSQTLACSDKGSYPFDQRASGLVSSEGYVAVVLVRADMARAAGLPILAELIGVGVSSDGKGKGLWAPRSEGQTLAIRRATDRKPLSLDYLECHATSTQVGDATELESLHQVLDARETPLLIGSVKSNLGHLLEAAGLVGLVKCLIAMRRGEIPPSIHFEQPNHSFSWDTSSLRVVDQTTPWPSIRTRKTAAVDAFGIGGLNAHAVIQEFTPSKKGASPGSSLGEPLAIVGRGLVLPGTKNVAALEQLLSNGRSVISDPPPERWPTEFDPTTGSRKRIGVCEGSTAFHVPHCRGGYIEDFQFDAQAYRIPPKLVARANPAQLMLIDAVRQAVEEFDGGLWSIDRKRTSVIIGSMFGGQFSNELQVGLRLPELAREVYRAAVQAGLSHTTASSWAEDYQRNVLKTYPALLDETGGFTASTLASRLARTFDLMGGACAIDADDASSSVAILNAAHQLASGDVDTVLCGTAGRAMDLVAFEELHFNGQLADPLRPPSSSKRYPCEGVVVLMLQRLSDAIQSDRSILGIIDRYGETFGFEDRDAKPTNLSRRLATQIGHLGGGQGLVETIAATCEPSGRTKIETTACDGYRVRYEVESRKRTTPVTNESHRSMATNAKPIVTDSSVRQMIRQEPAPLEVYLEDDTPDGLFDQLQSLATNPRRLPALRVPPVMQKHRAVIVGKSSEQLASAAAALLRGRAAESQNAPCQVLAKHAAFLKLFQPHLVNERIAWLFPGQGSQYGRVPELFSLDSETWRAIDRFDHVLSEMGYDGIRERLADPDKQLGKDVWWTQVWMLATSIAFAESHRSRGLDCDVVIGHSFGECTAAWASGAISLRDVIRFAKLRSEAVCLHGGAPGAMLSVRSEPSRLMSILQDAGNACVITHQNSPQQTVVAGSLDDVRLAKQALKEAGIAAIRLSVPAAFHTPGMRAARDVLRTQQQSLVFRAPSRAFLSAISNRYLAEPDDLRI
ncbi:MAG: beta-ketoacyl synthase N-terminal-like domain-containing protein, partial [Planctomycetota bacterium]